MYVIRNVYVVWNMKFSNVRAIINQYSELTNARVRAHTHTHSLHINMYRKLNFQSDIPLGNILHIKRDPLHIKRDPLHIKRDLLHVKRDLAVRYPSW